MSKGDKDKAQEVVRIVRIATKLSEIRLRLKAARPGRRRRRRRALSGAERAVEKRWRRPLRSLEELVATACEVGDRVIIRSTDSSELFLAMQLLWSRGCLIGWEILRLLSGGYPAGAHARWRTLHEVNVVAHFIAKHGEECATRYFDHADIRNAKSAREYRDCAPGLGYPPISEQELEAKEKRRKELIAAYDDRFDRDWGWAAKFLGKKSPDFRNLQDDVDLGHWRAHVGMSHHNVHGGPHGVLFRLGQLEREKSVLLLRGPSLVGLGEALDAAAISLTMLTTRFVNLYLEPRDADGSIGWREGIARLGMVARMSHMCRLVQVINDSSLRSAERVKREFTAKER